jgi:hypothetical protein
MIPGEAVLVAIAEAVAEGFRFGQKFIEKMPPELAERFFKGHVEDMEAWRNIWKPVIDALTPEKKPNG